MRFTAYYVVRAREELLAKWKGEPDVLLFREPELWTTEEGGRTANGPGVWTERFKLTFLLNVQLDYLSEKPSTEDQARFQEMLRNILGPKPWGVEVFDRWWTVERLDGVTDRAEAVLGRASAEDLQQLKGADEWRASLIGQR